MSGLGSAFSLGRKNWAMVTVGVASTQVHPGSPWMEQQESPLMSFPWEGRGMTWFWL